MEAIFIFLSLMILIMLFKRFGQHISPIKIRPPFRRNLPENPTRDELIAHAEAFWTGKKVPLKDHGIITACAGRRTFVYRDADGKAHIICYKCARKLLRKAYSDAKGTWHTKTGPLKNTSALDLAERRLKTMWFHTNHFYIVTYRGRLTTESERLPNFYPCDHTH